MDDHRVTGWLIPALLSTAVGLLGWVGINITKISENVAVLTARAETDRNELKEVKTAVKYLEAYAVIRKPR